MPRPLRGRVEFIGGGCVVGRDFRPLAPLGVTERGFGGTLRQAQGERRGPGVVRRAHHERDGGRHERVVLNMNGGFLGSGLEPERRLDWAGL